MREAKYAACVISLITACLFGGGVVALSTSPKVSTRDNFEIVEPADNVMTFAAETSVKTAATSKKEAETTNNAKMTTDVPLNTLDIEVTDISEIADTPADTSGTVLSLMLVIQNTKDTITDDPDNKESVEVTVTTTTVITTTAKKTTTTTTAAATTTKAATSKPAATTQKVTTPVETTEQVTEEAVTTVTKTETKTEAETEAASKEKNTDTKEIDKKEETTTAEKPESENNASGNKADKEENNLPISEKDYILLCNAVGHEAGSEWISTKEKATIVEVIMNRVKSPEYPNTVYGVLTQKYQFSGSGNYVKLKDFSFRVTDDVKKAVLLYFENPEKFNHGYLFFSGNGSKNYFY